MKQENKTQTTFLLWIDTTNQILSFKHAEGFEPLSFSSYAERLAFAFEKGSSGYRIQ